MPLHPQGPVNPETNQRSAAAGYEPATADMLTGWRRRWLQRGRSGARREVRRESSWKESASEKRVRSCSEKRGAVEKERQREARSGSERREEQRPRGAAVNRNNLAYERPCGRAAAAVPLRAAPSLSSDSSGCLNRLALCWEANACSSLPSSLAQDPPPSRGLLK